MTRANLQVTDYDAVGAPRGDDVAMLSAPLSVVLTQELDGACAALGHSVDDVLVAALGRAIARTIGQGIVGVVTVDALGSGHCGDPITLSCVGPEQTNATDMIALVHHCATTAVLERIVHGVPDGAPAAPEAEIVFAHGAPAPVGFGRALGLSAYRDSGVLALDWSYDTRRFEPYTVWELSEQFSYAVVELTSEATGPVPVPELAIAR